MYKILAVDDEPVICVIMQTFLTKKGFQVFTANSGEQGWEIVQKEKPDLLIVDKMMPGMGGLGLLKKLRENQINTPVLVLTGSRETPETVDEVKEVGYDDFLFKPIELAVLLERVNKRLGRGKNEK